MIINIETKEQIEICGYKECRKKKIVTVVLCCLTGGLLLLLLSWKKSIKMGFTHTRSPLGEADVVIVKDIYDQIFEEKVERNEVEVNGRSNLHQYFFNKKVKYVWDEGTSTYVRLSYPPIGTRVDELLEAPNLSEEFAKESKQIYGENETKIEVPSLWHLFIKQAFNPFYIFQVYTVILWCIQFYFTYSACILFLSLVSIVLNIWETRRQTNVLREKMISGSKVKVVRNDTIFVVESSEIVPGDIVLIETRKDPLEADMVLLEGSAVMNEAILTGESVPVTKIELHSNDDSVFSKEVHKKHILYSGTTVLQVRGRTSVKALVVQTGYETLKGEMIRSILFPRPINFQIYTDFLCLFFIFVVMGSVAMIWSLVHWGIYGNSTVIQTILLSLDLLTFVVPPILPATITAINFYGQKRLQKNKIYCLSSNYIGLSGNIDIICFDKTGTLTEDDLSIEGVLPCEDAEFLPLAEDLSHLPITSKFTHSMVTCHSLMKAPNGEFIGHPLDIKIFNALGWAMAESDYSYREREVEPQFLVSSSTHVTAVEYDVIKTYPFESGEQRMTVIGKEASSSFYEVFVKGAPEKIREMCRKESVPDSFSSILNWYSRQGMRMLATAFKPLHPSLDWNKIQASEREVLEEDSFFLGLIILRNRVKPETVPALRTIHDALLSTVMITGDNLLTALNVAKQCGLVRPQQQVIIVKAEQVDASSNAARHVKITYTDSEIMMEKVHPTVDRNYAFGIDGESFKLIRHFDQDTFKRIIHRGKVFARMKPDQKVDVIEALQQIGHQVAMCGDGCNDCGALKAAHAGISLSSSEASVAAPFTSLQRDITCVPTLIREGRATLISTYISLKYNIASCFTSLAFMLLLFSIFALASDLQFLVMDMIMFTVPSLFIGNTEAASKLSRERPSRRILHPVHVTSIISFIGFQTLLFWTTWQYLGTQSWYEPFVPPEDELDVTPEYEVTVSVLQIFFSYGICALVYSHDFPFRKPFYTNKLLTFYLCFTFVLATVFTFCQTDWLYDLMTFKPFPYSGFTWTVFLSVWFTASICYIWERYVLYGLVSSFLSPLFRRKFGSRLPYEQMEKNMASDLKWPKLCEEENHEPDLLTEANDSDNDSSDKTQVFMRKLTKKYHFKADDVKYQDELTPIASQNQNGVPSSAAPPPSGSSTFIEQMSGNEAGKRGTQTNQKDVPGPEKMVLQMTTFRENDPNKVQDINE